MILDFAPYVVHLLIMMCIFVIVAVSLQLALGYSGMLNLGHIALFGIGAYTSALLTLAGVPFMPAFAAAGLVAAGFGALLVLATKHLKGDYYALATLGFSFVVYSLLLNLTELTRGPLGIPGIPRPMLFGMSIQGGIPYLVFAAMLTLAVLALLYTVVRSPFGLLLEAMRDDELGVRALGKNTTLLKYKAMMLSAFLAGIAGSMFAHYISFIDPASFSLPDIILVLTIVIVGGLASLQGTVLATVVLLLIPEVLRFLALPSSILGPARQIIYALILLAVVMLKPRGFYGRIDLT